MNRYLRIPEFINAEPYQQNDGQLIYRIDNEGDGYTVTAQEIEYNFIKSNDLIDTIPQMVSSDYKDRFKAEYLQLIIRYTRLKDMCEKWDEEGVKDLGFIPTCPREIYDTQLKAMQSYIEVLEKRAILENIRLVNPF